MLVSNEDFLGHNNDSAKENNTNVQSPEVESFVDGIDPTAPASRFEIVSCSSEKDTHSIGKLKLNFVLSQVTD